MRCSTKQNARAIASASEHPRVESPLTQVWLLIPTMNWLNGKCAALVVHGLISTKGETYADGWRNAASKSLCWLRAWAVSNRLVCHPASHDPWLHSQRHLRESPRGSLTPSCVSVGIEDIDDLSPTSNSKPSHNCLRYARVVQLLIPPCTTLLLHGIFSDVIREKCMLVS